MPARAARPQAMDLETRSLRWSLPAAVARLPGSERPAHSKGIRTWAWSAGIGAFATGGVEDVVALWSPLVGKPVGALPLHSRRPPVQVRTGRQTAAAAAAASTSGACACLCLRARALEAASLPAACRHMCVRRDALVCSEPTCREWVSILAGSEGGPSEREAGV